MAEYRSLRYASVAEVLAAGVDVALMANSAEPRLVKCTGGVSRRAASTGGAARQEEIEVGLLLAWAPICTAKPNQPGRAHRGMEEHGEVLDVEADKVSLDAKPRDALLIAPVAIALCCMDSPV